MTELRVATYNVRHCEGLDGVVDPVRTASTIRATGATIVALQELDRYLKRTGSVDQPAVLSELTGLKVTFCPSLLRGQGAYGIALAAASAFESRFEPLHVLADEEPRGAIVGRVQGVSVIATHLSRRSATRATQLEQLAGIARDLEGPVLLLGDLNETSRRLRPLSVAGLVSDGRKHATLIGHRRQIDHILGGKGAVVKRTWTLESRASDHRALVADVIC